MKTIRTTQATTSDQIWEFSQLDLNCLKMTIKGLWVFKNDLYQQDLETSLSQTLDYYPHLSGRLNKDKTGIVLNNEGIPFEVKEMKDLSLAHISRIKKPLDYFNNGIKLSEFLKGNAAPLSIRLTQLADAVVLSVHCAHVCMDGNGFFSMMENWAKIHRQETIEVPVLKSASKFFSDEISKEEALKTVAKNKWKRLGINTLLRFIWQNILKIADKSTPPIHISDKYLNEIKQAIAQKTGKQYGTHAVLSALVSKLCIKLNHFAPNQLCSQLSVIDFRNRVDGVESTYIGNAVTNIPTPEFSASTELHEIVEIIDQTIKDKLNKNKDLAMYIHLNMATAKYKLPFIPFDLNGMNASRPSCFYVNNLLKFPIYNLDFGKGKPLIVSPNDLADAIKFWPSSPEKPGVDIYLRGYLAKRYNRLKNKPNWLNDFLQNAIQMN